MIDFNSKNIIAGYIKRLLHDFNLPSCMVNPKDEYKYDGAVFIEGNKVKQILDGKEKDLSTYIPGKLVGNNLQKNLIISNDVYDSYTHEYLGDYLRFIRDYYKVDLMPLYNCFSNRLANIDHNNFDSTDSLHRIYAVPVAFGKKYTIAIDCQESVEMFCGYYSNNKFYSTDAESTLSEDTAQSKSNLMFNQPFVYDKLMSYEPTDKDLVAQEDLTLFIKLPASNNSSIVILEGDYNLCARKVREFRNNIPNSHAPRIIYNYDELNEIVKEDLPLSTPLQLLEYNTKTSHPFADKLVGYLVDHTICPLDDIDDNFLRVNKQLRTISNQVKNIIDRSNTKNRWNNLYNIIITDYINSHIETTLYNKSYDIKDILGYYDKDVEDLFEEVDLYNDMIWTEESK